MSHGMTCVTTCVTSSLCNVSSRIGLMHVIPVIYSDIYARYIRIKGYEQAGQNGQNHPQTNQVSQTSQIHPQIVHVAGVNSHDRNAELYALLEHITPQELYRRKTKEYMELCRWFHVKIDAYANTNAALYHTNIQTVVHRLCEMGLIRPHNIPTLYCDSCKMTLSERFIRGWFSHRSWWNQAAARRQCVRLFQDVAKMRILLFLLQIQAEQMPCSSYLCASLTPATDPSRKII
jgi:methionyl-tRNA synthetase